MQNIDTFIRDQTILTKILDEAFSYCSAKKILVVYGGMHFKTQEAVLNQHFRE